MNKRSHTKFLFFAFAYFSFFFPFAPAYPVSVYLIISRPFYNQHNIRIIGNNYYALFYISLLKFENETYHTYFTYCGMT